MNNSSRLLVLVFSLIVACSGLSSKQIRKRRKSSKPVACAAPKKVFRKKEIKQEARTLPVITPIASQKVPQKPLIKKRIIIFSCLGGGGHAAVSSGLKKYLGDKYDITIVNTFQEVLTSIDTLGAITFGKIASDDFYNFCLRVRWTNLAGAFVSKGSGVINWRQGTVEKLFLDYFCDEKPDLIISVMPVINAALITVSEKLSIPFLVITNDLDTTNYINNIKAPQYAHFKYAIPFDWEPINEKIKSAEFKKEQLVVTGFPLRPEFFKEKDTQAIRRDFDIPDDKPVIMVFMGGAGSLASYRYVRCLAKMEKPMHIIVCLGRNESIRRNIKKIMLPEGVTTTIVGFTDRIADLMAVSDVLITKTGPNSMCEALESNVPMILDQTSSIIWWEQLNIDFMVANGFAESLFSFKDLPKVLGKYLEDPEYIPSIKKKMKEFKRERFDLRIKPLIEEMLASKAPPVPQPRPARPLRPRRIYSSVQKKPQSRAVQIDKYARNGKIRH